MGFWNNVINLKLQDFRPGIRSAAEFGDQLVMACMEISPGKVPDLEATINELASIVEIRPSDRNRFRRLLVEAKGVVSNATFFPKPRSRILIRVDRTASKALTTAKKIVFTLAPALDWAMVEPDLPVINAWVSATMVCLSSTRDATARIR